jgi:hypothetical protein
VIANHWARCAEGAPLPMLLGGLEHDLEPVLAPVPELDSRMYLVIHSDLRRTARVLAFCGFIIGETARFRSLLMGDSDPESPAEL